MFLIVSLLHMMSSLNITRRTVLAVSGVKSVRITRFQLLHVHLQNRFQIKTESLSAHRKIPSHISKLFGNVILIEIMPLEEMFFKISMHSPDSPLRPMSPFWSC